MTTFSVIIPTRNRADLLQRAIQSVAVQENAEFEIIVVNDGTSGADALKLDTIKMHYKKARFVDLPNVSEGHGPCRVINTGAAHANGDYVCFLDDDDVWLGTDYLADTRRIVEDELDRVDAVFFDQAAFRGNLRVECPVWIEDLGARLQASGYANAAGAYSVGVDQLLTAHGFSHTNVTVVRKDMFVALGGFDTSLWYEGDRDFYLRLIDAAKELRYRPKEVARHNVPDQGRSSMSNSTPMLKKALDQIYLLHKAARYSRHEKLRAYARTHRKYAFRKAAEATVMEPKLIWSFLKGMRRVIQTNPPGQLVTAL